ncbi:MAG: hemerythrin domain-containing protein [Ignavibacteriae bacterium]|nr:hemerythrin domain-containing protein [Ignavibacteriota bacterium]
MTINNDPIHILMREHEQASQALAQLENAVLSIDQTGFSVEAFEQIGKAIRFIGTTFREHDKKEERYLFNLLEKHQAGLTQDYRREHRELWSAIDLLMSCVRDVELGRLHGLSLRELIQTSKLVVELLRAHIRKENTILFPMVKELLSELEYDQLRNSIANSHA